MPFLTSDDFEKRRCHYYLDIHNASVLVLSGPRITTLDICTYARVGELGQMCGGKLFDRKPSRAHCSFVSLKKSKPLVPLRASISGGRFRSAMKRLGRLGELDDMLVHRCLRRSRIFRASAQRRNSSSQRLDSISDFIARSCDDQVYFAVGRFRAPEESWPQAL